MSQPGAEKGPAGNPPPAFEVTLGCGNCGNEWTPIYPPEVIVRDMPGGRVKAMTKDCEVMAIQKCDCCAVKRCPVCKLLEDVFIKDRTPFEEKNDE